MRVLHEVLSMLNRIGVPSKDGRRSEPPDQESSSLSCCCTARHPQARPRAHWAVHLWPTVAPSVSYSNKPPLSKPPFGTTVFSPDDAFGGPYEE